MYCSLPEVSSNMASVIGSVTSFEKNAICCGRESSDILKSSCFRSVTMRLLLSRTVTNRFTRLTCVRIPGGCCVSCGMAGSARPAATDQATQAPTTFFAERMYNFLVEYSAARSLTPRRMRRSTARDAWLDPPELLETAESVPSGPGKVYEKSLLPPA